MQVHVLMSPGCGHGERALQLVADVLRQCAPGAQVETTLVATAEDAARWSFPGSPTVLVNGVDIDPDAPKDVGLG